jgi:hypothetical protein
MDLVEACERCFVTYLFGSMAFSMTFSLLTRLSPKQDDAGYFFTANPVEVENQRNFTGLSP